MLQRLQCNVFMLSYRGYAVVFFYITFCFLSAFDILLVVEISIFMIYAASLTMGVIIFMINSYGDSDGYPSQHGITMDAQVPSLLNFIFSFDMDLNCCCIHSCFLPVRQAALDHLAQRTDIDTSRIVVFGRSLGGAVGAVVTKNNPDKVLQNISLFIYFLPFLCILFS